MLTKVLSLVFGVAVLVGFIYYVGVEAVIRILLSVNPLVIVGLAGIELIGFVFYATAWYVLILATGHRLRFLTCQGITFASIFASYTMPSGVFLEVTRCILGSKEAKMKLGETTATVILHRILYIVGFLGSMAIAFTALVMKGMVNSNVAYEISILPIIAIVGLIVLLSISLVPRIFHPLLDRLLRIGQPILKLVQKNASVDGKADQFLSDYNSSFRRMLSTPGHMLASFAASMCDWGCSVVFLWIVLAALGTTVSIWVVVITMAIGKMIQMTPIAVPGMIGIFEAAVTTSLALFGVPVAIGASAAILTRIVTSWLDVPITGVAAYHYGVKLVGQKRF